MANDTSLLLDVQRFTSPGEPPEDVLSYTMALNQFALQLDLDNMQLANGIVFAYLVQHRRRRNRIRRRRRCWVWPLIIRRLEYGYYDQLMEELRVENEGHFRNLFRMEPAMLHELLDHLTKHDTNHRKAMSLV